MLCGRPPFEGTTALGVLRGHRYKLPEQPKTLNPQLPAAVSNLVLSMLEKSPAKRPANMGLLANAIESLRRNLADERRERRPRGLEETATQRADRIERSAARTLRWAKRLVAVLVLAAAACGAWRLAAYLRATPGDYMAEARALEAGNYRAAIDTYEALLRRFPDAPEAGEARDRVNALVERYELGKQPLLSEQARHAMRAEMAYLHFRRAREAAERGRTEDAKRVYQFVCDHFPDTQWAPRADARLQELERRGRAAPATSDR
jgi:tetratricopeptide (TPR) repeat protein